jgi:hypothetical protein
MLCSSICLYIGDQYPTKVIIKKFYSILCCANNMASEIEDFELSLAAKATTETADSAPSTQKSRKTSPVHEHCRTPTLEERQEKPGSKWIWCKYCPKFPAQSTTNIRQHLDSIHGITVSKVPYSGIRTTASETIEVLHTKLLL